jgi:hypothetical protein
MEGVPYYGKLEEVNVTDVAGAVRLGCRTMQSVFDADDNDVPFFSSQVRPDAHLGFSPAHSEAHVPGRHLNALLNAEDALGVELDEAAVRKHAAAAYFSFSGPLPVPLNRRRLDGPLDHFLTHNLREGLHALYALVAYRGEERAHDLAEGCIAALLELWSPEHGWDRQRCRERIGVEPVERTLVSGIARMLGPLVKYCRATSSGAALDLALRLCERLLVDAFPADGRYRPRVHGGHTHSTTCVMSSLAQLAELNGDTALLQRVKAFYDYGLPAISDWLGWVIENNAEHRTPDRGEVNNSGDIVETALILGRAGYPQYLEDAERIVRCHILPAQLRDIGFIVEPPNPDGGDGRRNVAVRHRGAFGFPAPYGHEPLGVDGVSFNMDIVGGAVGSLCEVYRDTTTHGPIGHRVNLLLDHETDAIAVTTNAGGATLQVELKQPGPLWIRIPSWADRGEIQVAGARFVGACLFLPQHPVGTPVTLSYELPTREVVLQHRTRDIRVRLEGDSVVAMDNFGADLTFFDPIDSVTAHS